MSLTLTAGFIGRHRKTKCYHHLDYPLAGWMSQEMCCSDLHLGGHRPGGLAQTLAIGVLRCPEGAGLRCPLSPVDPCGARTGHSSSNTASLTTANPPANSPSRAGPGYGASHRGTAVPAVITGGTPMPQFMSLCIVQFLPALRFGVDVEGVRTPIPEPEVGLVRDAANAFNRPKGPEP
jgi:hypothetical protein